MGPAGLITLLLAVAGCWGHKLLKVPRIYNALITSDEELLPSQAYPAVAPVLRPAAAYLRSPEYAPAEPPPTPPELPPLPAEPEPSVWHRFKNNKPRDPLIPDVPPPPIPVQFRLSTKAS